MSPGMFHWCCCGGTGKIYVLIKRASGYGRIVTIDENDVVEYTEFTVLYSQKLSSITVENGLPAAIIGDGSYTGNYGVCSKIALDEDGVTSITRLDTLYGLDPGLPVIGAYNGDSHIAFYIPGDGLYYDGARIYEEADYNAYPRAMAFTEQGYPVLLCDTSQRVIYSGATTAIERISAIKFNGASWQVTDLETVVYPVSGGSRILPSYSLSTQLYDSRSDLSLTQDGISAYSYVRRYIQSLVGGGTQITGTAYAEFPETASFNGGTGTTACVPRISFDSSGVAHGICVYGIGGEWHYVYFTNESGVFVVEELEYSLYDIAIDWNSKPVISVYYQGRLGLMRKSSGVWSIIDTGIPLYTGDSNYPIAPIAITGGWSPNQNGQW